MCSPWLGQDGKDEEYLTRLEARIFDAGSRGRARQAVPELITRLRGRSKKVCDRIVLDLIKIGMDFDDERQLLDGLWRWMQDRDEDVRISAIACLEILGERSDFHEDWACVVSRHSFVDKLLPPLLQAAACNDSHRVRRAAFETLGTLESLADRIVPFLLDVYVRECQPDSTQPPKRIGDTDVLDCLARLGPAAQDAVPRLIEELRNPTTGFPRSAPARDVPQNCMPNPQEMEADCSLYREKAARALGRFGPAAAEAVPVLQEALQDRNEWVRHAVVKALGEIGPAAQEAIPTLRGIRECKGESERMRQAAAEALPAINPDEPDADASAAIHDEEAKGLPTIWYHGDESYSADGVNAKVVPNEQHCILQVFLDRDIALDTGAVKSRSGIVNVASAIGKLFKQFGEGAIHRPGRRGGGGYLIRVRTLPNR